MDAEQPNTPSVISSTSPLSPKHLEASQLAVVRNSVFGHADRMRLRSFVEGPCRTLGSRRQREALGKD